MIIIEKIAVCCRVFNAVVRLVGDPKERNDSRYVKIKLLSNRVFGYFVVWVFSGWVFSGLGVQ